MSWSAETVLMIRSRLPAAAFKLFGSVETTKLSAPISLAAASLLGEVEMAVTVLPMALASWTPIWPRPPMPTTPTLLPPLSAPLLTSGVNTVIPAQKTGPAASRG